jgi:hypothetical protein
MEIYLETSTFVGYDVDASHYYGTLIWEDAEGKIHRENVEAPLSATAARLLNEKDPHLHAVEGRFSWRFTSVKAVIKRAIQVYQGLGGTVLILGSPVIAEEQTLLHSLARDGVVVDPTPNQERTTALHPPGREE